MDPAMKISPYPFARALAAFLLLVLFTVFTPSARAADGLVTIDTRPGVTVSYWYMPRPGATATVVLLSGGGGGIGMKDGVPTSTNFLVRSRDLFAAHGFNVAIVGKPSDIPDLSAPIRTGAKHMEDLQKVVARLKADARVPVWMIGTSNGTISTAAAGIAFGDGNLAGIVLTSSITAYGRPGSVPQQDLDRIRLPVLVMHHAQDECRACPPQDVGYIMRGLKNSPIKKQIMMNGGDGVRGDPCEPLHYHGYIGIEKEAVGLIAAWIKHPTP